MIRCLAEPVANGPDIVAYLGADRESLAPARTWCEERTSYKYRQNVEADHDFRPKHDCEHPAHLA